MRSPSLKSLLLFAGASVGAMILHACASPGTPSGGARDENPPRFVTASPQIGSVNFSGNKATIDFNEIVNVKDAFSKVVVSPSSDQTPRVSSLGRRVTINFQDTLLPNTTYTVDFGNAIEDNNEGNKLQSFTYYFSTGPEIDTLQISGMVLGAKDLEPQQAMLVGIHSNPVDSTFSKVRFERMAKTDDRGRFTIRGLKEGKYRIFALGDLNNDYRWDNPEEDIAFLDVDISPYAEQTIAIDTTWNLKTGEIDTITERARTRFLPNDVLLNSFNIDYKAQYLDKYERIDSTRINLIFHAPADTLPKVSLVGLEEINDWYRLERSQKNDSLTYWITDRNILSRDTLMLAASYLRTDSAKNLTLFNDTIRLLKPKPKKASKADKEKEKKNKNKELTDSVEMPEMKFLDMKMISSQTLDVYSPIVIEFPEPLDTITPAAFRLEEKVDTLWLPAKKEYMLQPFDSISIRQYKIEYPWEYGGEYKLTVDSIAATGIYGLFTRPASYNIKVKKEEEYGSIRFMVTGLNDTIPAYAELLNGSDAPVRKVKVVDGQAFFPNLAPSTYYARIVEDINGNGEYDTGDYDAHRQPELTYYYPKAIKLKANWDMEQSWNVNEVALDMQKPLAIKKNKPERNKNQRQKKETETDEDDDYFDPSSNPFDSNDRNRRKTTRSL